MLLPKSLANFASQMHHAWILSNLSLPLALCIQSCHDTMQNDLEFLRIRSMKQEIMVAPRKLYKPLISIQADRALLHLAVPLQMQSLY